MTPEERARRAMEIFEKLYEEDFEVQAHILDEEVGDDALLREEVEKLLYGKQGADRERFLQRPAVGRPQQDREESHTIGAFRIVREIAQGGMGRIYEGIHINLGRKAAIKVPIETHHLSGHFAARLQREGRVLARLSHPNIVEVYDAGLTEDNRPFIAMAFIEGKPLSEIIAQGKTPPEQIIRWGRQIADALDCLHTANVYHRDIKSSNIMIDRKGDAILTDFGIAHIGDLTRITISSPGTLVYMCPEQHQDQPIDGRCDIYSLGLVLYEVATRQPLFDVKLDLLPKTSKDERLLARVIPRCIEKDPALRYQSGRELAEALTISEQPSVKRPLRTLVAAGFVVLMIAVSIVIMWPDGSVDQAATPPDLETPQSRLAFDTPASIQTLIDQGGSLNILGSQLQTLQESGELVYGTKEDFTTPGVCYVFVFEDGNLPFQAVLAPGEDQRIELLSGQVVDSVDTFVAGKGSVWVQLTR